MCVKRMPKQSAKSDAEVFDRAVRNPVRALAKALAAEEYRRLRGSLKGTKAMEVFMSERQRERHL